MYDNISTLGALSSVGRASALQAEGHRFESYSAHHKKLEIVSFLFLNKT